MAAAIAHPFHKCTTLLRRQCSRQVNKRLIDASPGTPLCHMDLLECAGIGTAVKWLAFKFRQGGASGLPDFTPLRPSATTGVTQNTTHSGLAFVWQGADEAPHMMATHSLSTMPVRAMPKHPHRAADRT